MVLRLYTWVGLVALLLPLLSPSVAGECIRLEKSTVLLNDLTDMKDRHCYRCYDVPVTKTLHVQLNRVRLKGLSSIMIYLDASTNHISKDCGECQEGTECLECKGVITGKMFELYVRQNKNLELEEGQNACQYIASFNISLDVVSDEPETEMETGPGCEKGFEVNFPQSDSCIVNATTAGMKKHCVLPTCSEGVLASDSMVEKIDHKFKSSISPETCIWRLNTDTRKHLTLTFSKDVQPYLTVFQDSLMKPHWDMKWCQAYSNTYRLETNADTVFILYHNMDTPTKKGSLSVTLQSSICLIPPSLENGNVEFQRLESGMVALYSCFHGYSLVGPSKLRCKDGAWSEPPVCLHEKETTEKEVEEAMIDIETDYLDEGTTLLPETEMEIDTASDIEWDENYPLNETLEGSELSMNSTETRSGGLFADLLDMKLYVIAGGAGLIGLFLLIIIIVVVYRKRYPMRLGIGRRFDTFQNPIYEKAVVRVPLQVEEPQPPPAEEKKASDVEEISNCTVLEP